MSAAAYAAMAQTGGLWTNKRMPAAATNIQQAICCTAKAGPAVRTAVCPHWGEIGIDDIYSATPRPASVISRCTCLLGDVILIQPDAYAQVAFKVA